MVPPSPTADKAPRRLAYIRFYPDDFRSSNRVALMDGVSMAFYALLLIVEGTFKGEGLPDNDLVLARLLRVDDELMTKIRTEVLNACFESHGGRLYNSRMEREIREVLGRSEALSEAGRRGAQARRRRSQAQARPKPGSSQATSDPSASSSPEPESEPSSSTSSASSLSAAGMFDGTGNREAWERFVEAAPATVHNPTGLAIHLVRGGAKHPDETSCDWWKTSRDALERSRRARAWMDGEQ